MTDSLSTRAALRLENQAAVALMACSAFPHSIHRPNQL